MDERGTRDRLLALRDDALRQLADLGVSHQHIVQSAEGANNDDEHDPEGSTIAFERELLQALITQTKARLAEVDLALGRVDEGTYGRCEVCAEPIAAARLVVRPIASRCVGCSATP